MGSTHKMWIGSVSLAIMLIASGILLGNQRLAHAQVVPPGLGGKIVCLVFTNLGGVPVPNFHPGTPQECADQGGQPTQCSDGIDNDGDGLIDFPADPGCSSSSDNSELPFNVDVCPNIPGTQITMFPGFELNSDNQCVPVGLPTDVCPNIDGTQVVVPSGDEINSDGNCVPIINQTPAASSTLQIIKHVINDNGGTKVASNFTINVAATNAATSSFPGSESTTTVLVDAGSYTVTESADAGYAASMSSDCSGTIAAGETKTCTITNNDIAPTPTTTGGGTPPSGGGNGGGGGGGGGGGQVLGVATSTPGVLGVNCSALLSSYLRKGIKNDPNEVKKLQEFLNTEMGGNLPITGFFGSLTHAVVNKFQLKYADDVLMPWVPYGLPNAKTPTGYVYKTTQRKVNLLHCSSLSIPLPQLP